MEESSSGRGAKHKMQYVPVSKRDSAAADKESSAAHHSSNHGSHDQNGGGNRGERDPNNQVRGTKASQQQQLWQSHGGYGSMVGGYGSHGMMMNPTLQMPPGMQLPQLMTPQQKDEQYQAIKSKLTVKSSLTEPCEKHLGFYIIFENSKDLTKYCEKCFQEQQDASQASKSIQEEGIESEESNGEPSQIPQVQ